MMLRGLKERIDTFMRLTKVIDNVASSYTRMPHDKTIVPNQVFRLGGFQFTHAVVSSERTNGTDVRRVCFASSAPCYVDSRLQPQRGVRGGLQRLRSHAGCMRDGPDVSFEKPDAPLIAARQENMRAPSLLRTSAEDAGRFPVTLVDAMAMRRPPGPASRRWRGG